MRVLCIAGFLGSGKTTLLRLARTMREDGLPVRELYGGCICCTLQSGLVETLRAIEAELDPDWVIVEPTGLAAPGDIPATVADLMPHLQAFRVLTLVDTERWEMLIAVVSPLIEAPVEAADVIALSKADLVDAATLETVEAAVRRSNAAAPVFPIAALSGAGLPELREALM